MFKNKWGICPWSEEFELEKVHPEDLEEFRKVASTFLVFQCIEELDDYLSIKFKENIYRITPELFQEISEPKFITGDKVKISENRLAEIFAVYWHYDKKEHYYFITLNGKKKTKRYSEVEFSI